MAAAWEILSVACLALVELWGAIPLGLAMGLNPALVCVISAAGATFGAGGVILAGERLRSWLLCRTGRSPGKDGWARRIWERFGVAGLGLSAPLISGVPLGAAIGVALGAHPRSLMLWISAGTIIWSVILTILFSAGLQTLGWGG
ncbi:MAG: hypothetical protein A4E45_02107 [Methanosaeta sp. PtaB.Bin039]|nr:MAG: hypothetical protein A4E45_02107 [Methanosaeta sp. PtaB.Bin039]HOT07300.1 small multi-drug export protein [Methanotrichaceae archaeon]HQF15825.1 small multi-drug export protein [Methanotrichaceae archaeon]HQI90499.1 small multi-drug export protein [Methanotrichaceae archaeon]HQJ28112.1 small multi-drug export protein [Methanotrichaceae archaeon]